MPDFPLIAPHIGSLIHKPGLVSSLIPVSAEEFYTRVDITAQLATLTSKAAIAAAFSVATGPDYWHQYDAATSTQNTIVGTDDITADGGCVLEESAGTILGVNGVRINSGTDSVDAADATIFDVTTQSMVEFVLFVYADPAITPPNNKGIHGKRTGGAGTPGYEFITSGAEGGVSFNSKDSAGGKLSAAGFRHSAGTKEPVLCMGVNLATGGGDKHQLYTNLGNGPSVANAALTQTNTQIWSFGAGRQAAPTTGGYIAVMSGGWRGAPAEVFTDRTQLDAFMDYIGIGWKHDREDL